MRLPRLPILLPLLLAAFPADAAAQEHKPAQRQTEDATSLRVPAAGDGEDRIHSIRARVRHTTVIVLPAAGSGSSTSWPATRNTGI